MTQALLFRHMTIRHFILGPFEFVNHELLIDKPREIGGKMLSVEEQGERLKEMVGALPRAASNPIVNIPVDARPAGIPVTSMEPGVARGDAATNQQVDLTSTPQAAGDASAAKVQVPEGAKQVAPAPTPTQATAAASAMAAVAKGK